MDWCGGSTNGSLPEPRPQGHLLIGPPGSGKSTLAAILAPLLPARVISNDALREQLWGDPMVQGPWSELEPHLYRAIDSAVAHGDNVLVDATHAQLNWRQRLIDLILICLSRPSKTKTNLFGVEKEKFFFDLIDFSSNKFLKSSKIFSLKFF